MKLHVAIDFNPIYSRNRRGFYEFIARYHLCVCTVFGFYFLHDDTEVKLKDAVRSFACS